MALHHFRTPRAILHPPFGAGDQFDLPSLSYIAGAIAGTVASLFLRRYLPVAFEPLGGAGLGVSLAIMVVFWLPRGSQQRSSMLRRVGLRYV